MLPNRRPIAAPTGLLLCALALAGCAGSSSAGPPDLILISIDTLRADRLGCYGGPPGATPELDRFCARAVRFATVVAQAPATLASHASIFTSRLPQHHGAAFAAGRALADSELTIAEVLRDSGYRTVAITAGGQMLRRFGVAQGFESFRAQGERPEPGAFGRKVDRALKILDEPDERPLFLFLHTYEVHLPYTPESALLARLDPEYRGELGDRIDVPTIHEINAGRRTIDAADARHIEAAQRAELISVDRAFGRLADAIEERRARRPTILVLTSDHGEELGEHGKQALHGHTLFDELLLVPWLIGLPSGEATGREIALPARGIDLAPTLLDLVGAPIPPRFEGRTLVPLIRGAALDELPAVFERSQLLANEEGPFGGVRWRGWKLHGGRLFDLRSDPGETVDRTADSTRERVELAALLEQLVAGSTRVEGERVEFDAEAASQLRALGYLQ